MRYQVKMITRLGIRYYDERILSGLKLEASREDDEYRYDFKESLGGKKITFTDQDSYALLYTIETALEIRDEPIYFVINQWCGNGWKHKCTATISIRDGEWDAEKCTVSFKQILKEKYKAWDDNKSTKLNLFDATTTRYTTSHPAILGNMTPIAGIFRNGVLLYDALRYAFRQYYPNGDIRSEVLGFNPDNPTTVLDNYKTLILFQNSDIIRRSIPGYTPATSMACSLDELVTNVCKLFNLKYRITETGDLRIDPLAWFQSGSAVGLNLTAAPHEEYNRRTRQWSYQNDKIFRREVFTTRFGGKYPHFRGFPIEYPNAATEGLPQGTDKPIDVTFTTDISYLSELDPDGDTEEYNGISIVATTIVNGRETESIAETLNTMGAGIQPNNVMGWMIPHDLFFKEDRLFKSGIMNFYPQTFNSTQRIRVQRGLKALLCCSGWNPLDLVTSGLGNGEVAGYNYDFNTGMVEMDLLFPVPDTNMLPIPTAIDDQFVTIMGATLDTLADQLASLMDNDSGALSVLPETKETAAGGQVVIDANGYFIYTPPNPAFYGLDSFDYTIIGASGYTDTATATIGVRWPDIYVRGNAGHAHWYMDAAGTQPLNVSGMLLELIISEAFSNAIIAIPAEGYSQLLGHVYIAQTQQYDYDQIQPSADYTII